MMWWCAIIHMKVPYKKPNGMPLITIEYNWTIQ